MINKYILISFNKMGIVCCIGNNTNNECNYNVPDNKNFYFDDDNSKENINNKSITSEQELFINNIETYNKSNKDIYNYIINSEYYILLLKNISPNVLIKKLCEFKNINDLIEIVNLIINFIINFNKENNNNIIKSIKDNINLGTKKLLIELNNYKNIENKKGKEYFEKSISDFSVIIHYFIYNNNNNNKIYKENYWKNKNIENEIKMNSYKALYNLIKAKNEINLNNNNFLNKNNTVSTNLTNVVYNNL